MADDTADEGNNHQVPLLSVAAAAGNGVSGPGGQEEEISPRRLLRTRASSTPGPMAPPQELQNDPRLFYANEGRAHSTSLTPGELYMPRRRRMKALRRMYRDFLDQFEPYERRTMGGEEDYSSEEEEEEESDEETLDRADGETEALLVRSGHKKRKTEKGIGRTVVTYVKGMIGTYILYLPHLFSVGGWVFSTVMLGVIAGLSHVNMLLLLRCRDRSGRTSYGEVAYHAAGWVGRSAVDLSLFLTQTGYCITYFIYVTKNLGAALGLPKSALLIGQILIYVPLSWVRRLKYLGPGIFIAQCGLVVGLSLTLAYVFRTLSVQGIAWEEVQALNQRQWIMYVGAVVSTFEGIGLVLPIHEAMHAEQQAQLPTILSWCNVLICLFYILVGLAGYFTYGDDVPDFLTQVMPSNASGSVAQICYSIAVILSFPLQLFPAVRVLERRIWRPPSPDWLAMGPSKKPRNLARTLGKNSLRTAVVLSAAAVAVFAGEAFDNFVGVVGGCCAVPLALIYPVWFHLVLYRDSLSFALRALHVVSILIGITAAIASTAVSLTSVR